MTRARAAGTPKATARSDIELDGLSKSYGGVTALDDVHLHVPAGTRLGLVGPSGCGKSTLLRLVAGLEAADGGHVRVGGARRPAERLGQCALMPQRDLLLPWRSALDNAVLALQNRGVPRSAARERLRPLFERFGLGGFESQRPSQLSGGMRQRIAFLRTLAADKHVLLLDEPFGALDSMTRGDMQMWLRAAMQDAGSGAESTILLVTHDVEEALLLCDEVVVLSHRPGRVLARIPVQLPVEASREELLSGEDFVGLRKRVTAELRG